MLWANRNGFFYVLDRATGKFLRATPFVKVNWASGLDANGPADADAAAGGRSRRGPATRAAPTGTRRRSARAPELFYVSAWEGYASIYRKEQQEYMPGRNFGGGGAASVTPVPGAPGVRIGRTTPINNWTDAVGHGVGDRDRSATRVSTKWKFEQFDVTDSGILTTGVGSAVHRRTRRVFPRARRAHRRAAVEGEPRRPDRQRPDHLRGRRQAVRGGRSQATRWSRSG